MRLLIHELKAYACGESKHLAQGMVRNVWLQHTHAHKSPFIFGKGDIFSNLGDVICVKSASDLVRLGVPGNTNSYNSPPHTCEYLSATPS